MERLTVLTRPHTSFPPHRPPVQIPALPDGICEGKSPDIPDPRVFILKMEILAATSGLVWRIKELQSRQCAWRVVTLRECEPSLSCPWRLSPISPQEAMLALPLWT